MELITRIELVTLSLPRIRSTDWAISAWLRDKKMVAGVGLEPTTFGLWARRATNCSTPRYLVDRVGFEPTKAMPADLQSAPFDRSGICPYGAGNRTWTYDLLITNQLLYQLSYASTQVTNDIIHTSVHFVNSFLWLVFNPLSHFTIISFKFFTV